MDESEFGPGNVDKAMLSAATQLAPSLQQRVPREVIWDQYVGRAANGDPEALARLYDESSSLVYSLALRILGETADAEEVTLDVYTQVWRSAKNFDRQRGTAAAWLVTLTRSRAINRLRTRASRSQREEPLAALPDRAAGGESPEQASALSEKCRQVRAALEALPAEQRQAIELAFFSGLSHTEVAIKLRQPLGTVKTRIRLGMMKLRESLGAMA